MPNIDAILREINKDLVPQLEGKLRAYLAEQDKEWLIKQVVRLTPDAHSLEERDRKHVREEETKKRQARAERVKSLKLDREKLDEFIHRHQEYNREKLIEENFLLSNAPAKGIKLITAEFRSAEGDRIGDGIITALKLINHLEINEEILYGRVEKIERSTLVS